MSNAKLKAKKLIQDYGIDEPSVITEHLEDLCFELGAAIQFRPLEGAEARIVAKGGKAIITVNSAETQKERVRFSIGHELGHFVLHCDKIPEFNCSKKNMNEWYAQQKAVNMEVEANEFSIELLIPEKLGKELIKSSEPSIEAVENLANTFKMSLSSSVMRYVELSSEPVAVVFYSKAKGIRFFRTSKYFEAQDYRFHFGLLDKESFAHDVVNGKIQRTMGSVAASAWLDLPTWLQEEVIQEQTRYFPQYDSGFSLLWIEKGKILRN